MIYHKGRWLIAPEIKALLDKLEDMNEELRSEADRVLRENTVLREKQESADRQIAEYKRILKAAVDDLNNIGSCKTCVKFADICRGCRTDYKWVHADEALTLIGEDGDTNG
jgi:hypothetical protein